MKQNTSAISRFQDFLETQKGQTILNYLYSWGAAVVILGALFKLTHIEGADLMLFLGMGTEEGFGADRLSKSLNNVGINTVYYESPGTAHEWLTWRRCLNEFIPYLFK